MPTSPEHPVSRTPPDRPEHDLLRRFLEGWARTAARGNASPEPLRPVVYLEAFASGVLGGLAPAAGEAYATALGAAAVLDAAGAEAAVILVEEDPEQVRRLVERLAMAGYGARVRCGGAGEPPRSGEIRVVEGAFAEVASALATALEGAQVLCWAEPPRAGALPHTAVEALTALEGLTLLLRFPSADFLKQSAHADTPLSDLVPYARRLLNGCSALLGDARHRWWLGWRAAVAERGADAAARAVAGEYAARLADADLALLARTLPLTPSAGEPLLLLLTRDVHTHYLLNRALFEARRAGVLPVPADAGRFVRFEESGELELFGAGDAPRRRAADLAAVADEVAAEFGGREASFAEVLRTLLPSELLLEEVKRALTQLRGEGRVRYRLLSSPDAELVFPTTPTLPPARAPRRRTSPPPGAVLWDDLF